MKALLIYLLQLIIASGILYGYYHLFLRNKKFHQYNRYYLLAATVISIIIPFFQIPVYFSSAEEDSSIVLQTLKTIYYSGSADEVIIKANVNNQWTFDWTTFLYLLYSVVVLILFARIIISLKYINKVRRKNYSEELNGIHFINTDEAKAPFSFFNWLFWNKKIELNSEKGQQIFRHEVFHIQQKHSYDVLFIEVVSMILWINPFFHLIKKELRAIHEFLADQFAVKEEEKWNYAELLLMQALQTKQHLINPFFHNQIKRRIVMITNPQKTSHRYLRKLLVLPLTVLITMLFAFSYKNKKAETSVGLLNEKNIDVFGKKDTVPENNSIAGYVKISKIIPGLDARPSEITVNGQKFLIKGVNIEGVEGAKIETAEINISSDTTSLPLLVIDGVKQAKNADWKNINPNDIESITILKDKTAVEKYGIDAQNGVIEIKTKKPDLKEITVVGHGKLIQKDSNETKPSLSEVTVTGYGKLNKKTTDDTKPAVVTVTGYKTEKIFEKVETAASFNGGNPAWKKYLERNLNPNVPIENKAPKGNYTVIVQFIVKTDGIVADVKALTKHGYGMEDEAMQIIKNGPAWIPAKQNGHEVNSYKLQPITFVVMGDDMQPDETKGSVIDEVTVVGYPTGSGKIDTKKSSLNEVVVSGYKSTPKEKSELKGDVENLSPIYPNPSDNSITIPFSTQTAGKGVIRITDMNGNLKITNTVNLTKGLNNFTINVASLAKGTYVINVADANTRTVRVYKMVKQ